MKCEDMHNELVHTILPLHPQLEYLKVAGYLYGIRSNTINEENSMGILDKAKEISGKVSESVTEFSSDEVIANTIIRAVEKQEKVNSLLKKKGSNYRVSDIELEMGIPPTVSFGIRRVETKRESLSHDSENE